jgi:hypothetical protein
MKSLLGLLALVCVLEPAFAQSRRREERSRTVSERRDRDRGGRVDRGNKDCSLTFNRNERECRGSAPDYCQYTAYRNDGACVGSAPDFCSYTAYRNDAACRGSAPDYCDYTAYRNDAACAGSQPDYCQYTAYRNDAACRRGRGQVSAPSRRVPDVTDVSVDTSPAPSPSRASSPTPPPAPSRSYSEDSFEATLERANEAMRRADEAIAAACRILGDC